MPTEIRSTTGFLITLAITGLSIVATHGAEAATYTEVITADPSTFNCTTSADIKSCYGYVYLFPPPPEGTGTLVSGSGVFYGKTGDTVNIDISYTSPLYVPIGTGPAISGKRPYDIAYDVLYEWNGSQIVISTGPSSAVSTVTGYEGPPGLITSETNAYYTGFVGFGAPHNNPAAFSITGIDSTITLLGSDPYPVYEVLYGYEFTVPEPATWTVLLVGLGVVGATIRTRRRQSLMVDDPTTRHAT